MPGAEAVAPSGDTAQPTLWLAVLNPVPIYSVDMDLLGTADWGDWYQVAQLEEGWALGVWELDPPDQLVWIPLGPDVTLTPA